MFEVCSLLRLGRKSNVCKMYVNLYESNVNKKGHEVSAHDWSECALISTLASSQSRDFMNHALAKRNGLFNGRAGFF